MKIAPDKWKHFYVGIGMGAFLQYVWHFLAPDHIVLQTVMALIFSIGISYGFEVVSLVTGKGHYEVMDAVAGTIGALLGMTVVLMIRFFLL